MDPLREIVKAHVRATRHFTEIVAAEEIAGEPDAACFRRAELTTTCEFYEEVKRILEEMECEP